MEFKLNGVDLLDLQPPKCRKDVDKWLGQNRGKELWVESKFDGRRFYAVAWDPDRIFFTSTRRSEIDGRMVQRQENVPHLVEALSKLPLEAYPLVLDGEIVDKTGKLGDCGSIMGSKPSRAIQLQELRGYVHYYVFDMLFRSGDDIRKLPLWERKVYYLEPILFAISCEYIHLVRHLDCSYGKKQIETVFKGVLRKGFEGVVIKDRDAGYHPYHEMKRPINKAWCKWKKKETIDVVICGTTESEADTYAPLGWIKSIVIGLYNSYGQLIPIGQTSGMSEHEREFFSTHIMTGQVIEVEFQQFNPDDCTLRHPRFIRLRDDQNPKEQTFAKYNLKVEKPVKRTQEELF